MHPPRFPVGPVSPADLDLDYMDVTLSTEDNLTLHGWYIPSTNRAAVILVHAFNGNRTGTIFHAALLANHGYGVLLYDTRSQGESEGDLYALGWEDYLDVFAALDYLQQRPEVDAERIGVLGLSAGAKAALQEASVRGEEVPNFVMGAVNRLVSGQRLLPDQRNDFVDRAKKLYTGMETQHKKRVKTYTDLAKGYEFNPDTIVVDLFPAQTMQPDIVMAEGECGNRRSNQFTANPTKNPTIAPPAAAIAIAKRATPTGPPPTMPDRPAICRYAAIPNSPAPPATHPSTRLSAASLSPAPSWSTSQPAMIVAPCHP